MLFRSIMLLDRLCTGFAVAEIDLSKIDTVRTKMPISMVTTIISIFIFIFAFWKTLSPLSPANIELFIVQSLHNMVLLLVMFLMTPLIMAMPLLCRFFSQLLYLK